MMTIQWFYWLIRNSLRGLLVPMVQLVPIEKDVIPMVLLVNKARSKYKHAKCILRSIGNLCTFTPSKKALIVIINIPRSISQPRKTISLSYKVETL